MSDVTRILDRVQQGDPKATEELLPLVYEELRKLAAHKMANEAPGQTLQPTALVHEAYLRLVGTSDPPWDNRAHFFAAAAEAMRRILVDKARRKRSLKHGGGLERVDLTHLDVALAENDATVLAVLPRVPPESAIALGTLRRQGFAVTAILIGLDDKLSPGFLGGDTERDQLAYASIASSERLRSAASSSTALRAIAAPGSRIL